MYTDEYRTLFSVENAIVQLGDIDASEKGRQFRSRFIQAGIAGYPKQFGTVLITKETLDKFVNTLVDKPVIINHKEKITEDDIVGRVTKVWFNSEDGWFWCEGFLTDETAINLIKDKKWSVSCSYDVLLLDDEGGTENNVKYDQEFLNGVFTHLAIVENPRYERANIVINSKTEIINNEDDDYEDIRRIHNDRWITVHPNGEDEKGRHLLIQDGEDLKEAMQRQWGVYDKRQAKLKSDEPKQDEKKSETEPKQEEKKENKEGGFFTKDRLKEDKPEAKESSDSPFGEGVEIKEHDRKGMFLDSKNLKSFKKGEKFAILDDFSSEGRERYKVSFHDGNKQLESKTYSTKRGMEKAIREHLQGGANKETKALETKSNLEEKENTYKEVLKRYEENHRKMWSDGLSNAEYYKAAAEAEKAKKEITTARREYAESIMANFEQPEDNPYQDKIDTKRGYYQEKSADLQKSSERNWQLHEQTRLPLGQPIINPATARAYKRTNGYFDKSIADYNKSKYYAEKANSYGSHGISADDANAIAKLAQKYKSGVTSAEKRRIIDRVIDIHRNRQAASDTSKQTDYSDLGFQVERNTDMNRLQLKFNGKPDEKTRSILKSNGFRWSPTQGAWQRQLNGNSEYGLKRVVEGLQKVDNSLTKGIKKIFNSYVPTAKDIPLLQGLIDIFEKNNK